VISGVALAYVDTSALVKLVIAEPESAALRRALRSWPHRVSSEMAVVELLRVARRAGVGPSQASVSARLALERRARAVLAGLALAPLSRSLLLRAAQLDPPGLRSLDAIHLASALDLVSNIAVFFAYDLRLQQAAEQAGLVVQAPA
jgi:predicted nucleic acid-binding protein